MDYNTPENLDACYAIVKQTLGLLYYSHIPAIVLSLLIGFFVLVKDKRSLVSKLLFALTLSFSCWATINLAVWLNYDKNTFLMFIWSFFGIFYALIYIFSLYFVYVFLDKKDISLNKKILLGLMILPIIIFTPTVYNTEYFDASGCIVSDGNIFSNYYYLLGLVVFFWILILAFLRYRKAEEEFKKQIIFLTIGIELFLFSFFVVGFLVNYLVNNGYIVGGDYGMELYGLFGMPIFIGLLAYLIVKFKAFNIKLIGAQVLVIALVVLVGSQFFFIQTNANRILTGITLALVGIFGIFLIRSIKAEVQRKEELQYMSDRLAEANDKLRKLDNAKSEFISIASHQLRTPLTAIKGFISLLNEGSYGQLAPEQADVLKKVFISNERLINLVEDLLNISRIESGRMEFKFESCQLTDLCSELIDTFNFKAKDAGLYLDFKVPENVLPEVFIDSAKVREVLSNLIDNAIKYTPKGGVSVRLERVFPQDSKIENVSEKGSVKVIVADTGIGVPAEEIPYLFSKFSRGKDTSRLNVSGTGLGLYVGRSMIEANGGRIWVESDGTDKGSRFIIEVPVEQTQENLTRWS